MKFGVGIIGYSFLKISHMRGSLRRIRSKISIFTIVGIGIIIYSSITLAHTIESVNWPTTTGYVIETSIDSYYSSQDKTAYYTPIIVYEFTVEGQNYTSDHIRTGGLDTSYGDEEDAQAVIDTYSLGSSVTVHYDPDDPSNCALETEVQAFQFIYFLVGLIFIYGENIFSWAFEKMDRDKEEEEIEEPETDDMVEDDPVMKINICQACGMVLSKRNKVCPDCGAPIE